MAQVRTARHESKKKIDIDANFMINELKQEKIILEKLNEILMKEESISEEIFDSMSHELRTPVVSIKAYTDMLINGNFGHLSEEQKEKLTRIKTNTDLLLDVIFQLLEKKNNK